MRSLERLVLDHCDVDVDQIITALQSNERLHMNVLSCLSLAGLPRSALTLFSSRQPVNCGTDPSKFCVGNVQCNAMQGLQ